MIITYGVYGKVEFAISIIVGSKSILADFEGGSISARGVHPATYRTNCPVTQRAIESTPEYRVGIIKRLDARPEAHDMITAQRIKAAQELEAAQEREASENREEEIGTDSESLTSGSAESPMTVQVLDSADETSKQEVRVTCLEDAVEYLKAHYEGYSSSKLRTKSAVEHAAEEHGIVFVGL